MKQTVLRETLHVDENNQLHIRIPVEMGEQVEVIIFSSKPPKQALPDSTTMVGIMGDNGVSTNVLDSSEEDCWNDL